MSEREGPKFFFLLQAILAALFLIVGVALAIEADVRCDSDAFAAVKPVTRDTA
jgi:hypothetical protein